MSSDSRSAAPGEKAESIVQVVRQLRRSEHREAAHRQLDRERDAIELSTDRLDVRAVVRSQLEAGNQGGRTIHEQLDGFISLAPSERRDLPTQLATDRQRLSTRRDDVHLSGSGQKGLDELRHVIDEVLTVVEHEQQAPVRRARSATSSFERRSWLPSRRPAVPTASATVAVCDQRTGSLQSAASSTSQAPSA